MSRYDDIIHLPHFEPKYHERLPMADRAAQFAPFSALTGLDATLREASKTNAEDPIDPEFDLPAMLSDITSE